GHCRHSETFGKNSAPTKDFRNACRQNARLSERMVAERKWAGDGRILKNEADQNQNTNHHRATPANDASLAPPARGLVCRLRGAVSDDFARRSRLAFANYGAGPLSARRSGRASFPGNRLRRAAHL